MYGGKVPFQELNGERHLMKPSWFVRAGVLAAAGALALVTSQRAWAIGTVDIDPGAVPTTASGFGSHDCAGDEGGGPYPDQDVWVFTLPGDHDAAGDFISVTGDFAGNGQVTVTIATDPGNFANGGPDASTAWLVTPRGWTLTGGTAMITGLAGSVALAHTCPAYGPAPENGAPTGSASALPAAVASPSPAPSPSPSASPAVPAPSPSVTADAPMVVPSGPTKTGGGGSQPDGDLLAGAGALVVAAGSGLGLALGRRRDAAN